ncbi:hypothetical protein [Paracoccus sp. (in: a-proteobacteria)]|uniref:hypothetical protein n=1 Tax=Paracoccus sp. TaxID=267 RepID=UPI00334297E1
MSNIRHEDSIVDEIHKTLAATPRATDQAIITETADRTGFPLAMVLAVFDARFKDHGVV